MQDIKVVIFEDNDELREMLAQMIDLCAGFVCTDAYANALDLVHKMRRSEPDVVLMDIDMPGITGIEAVRIIHEHFPGVLVLMQTIFEDSDKVFDSLCGGASGYILKNQLSEQVIPSIKELVAGGAPMSPSVARKIVTRFKEQNPYIKKEELKLSSREKEILAHLVKGMSVKMIAAACFISPDTVKFHIRKIYEKLHVNSRGEAVAKAVTTRSHLG